jgi:alkyldihydroxyacetonephosphate synthase
MSRAEAAADRPGSPPGPRREMRWWGWGEREDAPAVGEAAAGMLKQALGLPDERPGRASLDDVRMPDPALPDETAARIASVVGADNVLTDRLSRVRHALGRSYPDLVRLRAGDGSSAPDAVVRPGSRDEVARVLDACDAAGVAVVPFGGGTSVVGGVEPVRQGLAAAISLDLGRMDFLQDVDQRSLTAVMGPGLTGPDAEGRLGELGLTLGHFPQSFEFATIGGYVATRSAGQASTGYGRFDEQVLGLRCATPAGEVVAQPWPASAAGPALRELLVGSEGILGVITEVTLAVRRRPAARRYEGWWFRSFAAGAEGFRLLEQEDAGPDVARLSDEAETLVTSAGSAHGGWRPEGGSLAVVGWEGTAEDVERRVERTRGVLEGAGGSALGPEAGEAWLRNRYDGPYLRDELMDRGVLVETLETATSWSNLSALYRGVGEALRGTLEARGTPALVTCHVSHLYRSGASLYFTFLARQERGAELEQWRAAKSAATDAIVAARGTITHHHAVGRDHAAWMPAEVGPLGVEVLRAAKDRLDPRGIMNPGKLLPPAS